MTCCWQWIAKKCLLSCYWAYQKLQALGVSPLGLDRRVRIHDAVSDLLPLKCCVPQPKQSSNSATKLATSGPATIQHNSWDAFCVNRNRTTIAFYTFVVLLLGVVDGYRRKRSLCLTYDKTHLSQTRNGHWGGFFSKLVISRKWTGSQRA